MADLYALTESDIEVLRGVIYQVTGRNKNPRLRGKPEPDTSQSPEVYVAKTPPGGIPATVGSTPGSAVCNMSRIVAGSLVQLQKTRKVYSLTAVDGDTQVQVVRDKLGAWWALPAGTGGGGGGGGTFVATAKMPSDLVFTPGHPGFFPTWADTLLNAALPSAGSYLFNLTSSGQITNLVTGDPFTFSARLFDVGTSAVVAESTCLLERGSALLGSFGNNYFPFTTSWAVLVTTAAATTVRLEAQLAPGRVFQNYDDARIMGSNAVSHEGITRLIVQQVG